MFNNFFMFCQYFLLIIFMSVVYNELKQDIYLETLYALWNRTRLSVKSPTPYC